MRLLVSLFLISASFAAAQTGHLLLRNPALSKSQIVFTYAGDLWSVSREGGEARRLTTSPGTETSAVFSPDGTTIAFTGEYDGNVDVFTIPAAGGVPKRLPTILARTPLSVGRPTASVSCSAPTAPCPTTATDYTPSR